MTRSLGYFILLCIGCQVRPALHLDHQQEPDYTDLTMWAAHPLTKDSADLVPDDDFIDQQDESGADVFFVHPTTYTGSRGQKYWNAPIVDPDLIAKTDATTIRHQASIFNGAGRVFAPRYRQAHIHAYFSKKELPDVDRAFELAYQDVRQSFLAYLRIWNTGRPIIIAAHSQGTTHAIRLIKELFDGKELQQRLVVAYLVGMPVRSNEFASIAPCQDASDVGCFCSWRTFKSGYLPRKRLLGDSISVTNPLIWTTRSDYAKHQLNEGGVLRKYHRGLLPQLADAQSHRGILWASKPKFPGSFLMTFKNYHVADYNLYWVNVRRNAQLRWASFRERIKRKRKTLE